MEIPEERGPQAWFDLTTDQHARAEELIGELQDRVRNLSDRRNSALKTTCRTSSYEPTIHTVKIGDEIVVIKFRQSELSVSHGGKDVLRITGVNLDLVDVERLEAVISLIQRYMVLDDLANI